MKILLCTTTFKNIRNGPTKFAHMLYNNATGNEGLEVHVLSEDITVEGTRLYRCKIGFLKKILPVASAYRMVKYYRRARQLNKQHHFDYILYNNAIYGLVHGLFSPNVAGMINDYNNQSNIRGKHAGFNYQFIKKKIFKNFEKKAIKSLHLIITNSDYLTKLLQSAYPAYGSKIFRLYKGIDINSSNIKNDPNWDVNGLEKIKILFVKNDFITGGIEILAQSLSSFKLNFRVTIVGPGERYFHQIQSFFKGDNVVLEFLGPKTQDEVFSLMSTHHIFCVPSLQEALGVANLEALDIGIPVVTSDAGGIPEVMDYGNCGFMSHAGDSQSLKKAMELCLYNKELRNKKTRNGLEHVKKFKIDLVLQNLKKILGEN